MVCQVWLRDEALNALKKKGDDEQSFYFVFVWLKRHCFDQNMLFHLNKTKLFWLFRVLIRDLTKIQFSSLIFDFF